MYVCYQSTGKCMYVIRVLVSVCMLSEYLSIIRVLYLLSTCMYSYVFGCLCVYLHFNTLYPSYSVPLPIPSPPVGGGGGGGGGGYSTEGGICKAEHFCCGTLTILYVCVIYRTTVFLYVWGPLCTYMYV